MLTPIVPPCFLFATQARRVEKTRLEEQRITARRHANALREEERWSAIDKANQKEEQKWEYMRTVGAKAQRNNSSVPYDPITLKYNDTHEGEKLKYTDDMIRYRAGIRSNYLYQHSAGDGYNPLTGAETVGPKIPPKPTWDDQGSGGGGGGGGH